HHLGRDRFLRREVVAQARVSAPTFDIVAYAVVATYEADPPGVEGLCGQAQRELAKGANPRGFSRSQSRNGRSSGKGAAGTTDEIGEDLRGALVEEAG